jgi:hypothetical protein
MKHNEILQEILSKYGEWFEAAGDNSSALLVNILCDQLIKSREMNEYFERRLANADKRG